MNTENPQYLLSVIIPVYNVSLYLDQCVASVFSQGIPEKDIQIILVEDGSTDGSHLIAEKWAHRHSNVLVHSQKNSGLSAARNAGLDLASGEFLIFLDSDDIVPDDTYRKMIDMLQTSGSDFVTGPAYRFSKNNKVAWPFRRNFDLFQKTQTGLTLETHPQFFRDFTAWNKMYRRNFFVDSGVRFPVGRIYEDVATSPLLYAKARAFDVYSDVAYYWRITPGSITRTIKPVKALDRLWALDHVQQYFLERRSSPAIMAELGFAFVDYNLRWIYLDLPKFDQETQLDILLKTEALLQEVPNASIARVDAPLSEWSFMSKHGKNEELAAIIRANPEIPNQNVSPNKTLLSRTKKFARRVAGGLYRRGKRINSKLARKAKSFVIYRIFRPFVYLLPIKENTAVFSNYWGKKFSLSDGPAALSVELAKQSQKYNIIVFSASKSYEYILKQVQDLFPTGARVKVVKNKTLSYFYYLWRAKYLFNDVNFLVGYRGTKFVEKRPGQIEVQTTHGIPIKKMGVDSETSIKKKTRRLFLAKSQRYDYLVSSSPLVAEIFSKAHRISPKILETGLPQNDFLFEEKSVEEIEALKLKYGLDPSKKTIVYAPTFRNDKGFPFSFLIDFRRLYEELGDEYQFVIKMHPYNYTHLSEIDFLDLTDFAPSPVNSPFVKLFGEIRKESAYSTISTKQSANEANNVKVTHQVPGDINEFMFLADVLISDYSSLIFNYSHLYKPLIVFTPDIEQYDASRGSYFNIDEIVPGAVAKTNDELLNSLKIAQDIEVWAKEHTNSLFKFKHEYLFWENGKASVRILKTLNIIL